MGRHERWLEPGMLYAEEGCHVYGACPSPDDQYMLFTRSAEDLGVVDSFAHHHVGDPVQRRARRV